MSDFRSPMGEYTASRHAESITCHGSREWNGGVESVPYPGSTPYAVGSTLYSDSVP